MVPAPVLSVPVGSLADVALALYRKYRPATFAEVVGQEHVTEPLSIALEAGRINHAYLFSGPRGCGKTSTRAHPGPLAQLRAGADAGAVRRLLRRACRWRRSGPGNIDVVELDAASHGGVDDTRELRDRAFYAPAESRYRVFIVDEAHMVTTQGFNALLKIVEEPPEHLVFVFATTEPEKVLPTIRSRTHHYPFRLIPPGTLRKLLERICAEEEVTVAPAVYPLVIRAGGGSARDSLSVLDQLVAGAGPEGVTYERAVALLGVTDVALIDDVVDALAAGDGRRCSRRSTGSSRPGTIRAGSPAICCSGCAISRSLQAVPEAVERGLVDAADDEIARMVEQSGKLGAATLTRYGEILHVGLTEMRGATAPRLLLELLCARMLLPAATTEEPGLLERLERLERRSAIAAGPPAPGESGAGGDLSVSAPPGGGSAQGGGGRSGAAAGGATYSRRSAASPSAASSSAGQSPTGAGGLPPASAVAPVAAAASAGPATPAASTAPPAGSAPGATAAPRAGSAPGATAAPRAGSAPAASAAPPGPASGASASSSSAAGLPTAGAAASAPGGGQPPVSAAAGGLPTADAAASAPADGQPPAPAASAASSAAGSPPPRRRPVGRSASADRRCRASAARLSCGCPSPIRRRCPPPRLALRRAPAAAAGERRIRRPQRLRTAGRPHQPLGGQPPAAATPPAAGGPPSVGAAPGGQAEEKSPLVRRLRRSARPTSGGSGRRSRRPSSSGRSARRRCWSAPPCGRWRTTRWCCPSAPPRSPGCCPSRATPTSSPSPCTPSSGCGGGCGASTATAPRPVPRRRGKLRARRPPRRPPARRNHPARRPTGRRPRAARRGRPPVGGQASGKAWSRTPGGGAPSADAAGGRPPADRPQAAGGRWQSGAAQASGGRPAGRPAGREDGVPLPPEPPEEDTPPDDEEAMLAELDAGPSEQQHAPARSDPEEAAIALLTSQLGARAIDRR